MSQRPGSAAEEILRDLAPIVARRMREADARVAVRVMDIVDGLARGIAREAEARDASLAVGLADAYGERGLPLPSPLPPVVERR